MGQFHHPYSCSGAHRWLNCPGSVLLSKGIEDKPSAYAEEGTAAHEVAAAVLEGKQQIIDIEDRELLEGITEYVHTIRVFENFLDKVEVREVEVAVDHATIEDFGGTMDAVIAGRYGKQRYLAVFDLKWGKGVAVDAVDNPQLMSYLVLARQHYEADKLIGTIVQPRTGGRAIKSAVYSNSELTEFEQRVVEAQQQDHFKAGDWCRWCKAAVNCDHLYQLTLEAAREGFSNSPTAEQRERWLELLRIEKAIKSLYERLPAAVLSEIEHGHSFDGYKAVQAIGNRAWIRKDDVTWMLNELKMSGVPTADITETKLRSPSQVEKKLGKKRYDKIKHLVVRPNNGIVLAPEKDRRAAVDLGVNFEPIEGGDV